MRTVNTFYTIVIILTIFLILVIYCVYVIEMDSGLEEGNKVVRNSIIYDRNKKEMEFDILATQPVIITISNNIKLFTRIIINNKTQIDHKMKIEGITNRQDFIPIVKDTTVILYRNKKWEMGVGTKEQGYVVQDKSTIY